jgi:hypothetical protein
MTTRFASFLNLDYMLLGIAPRVIIQIYNNLSTGTIDVITVLVFIKTAYLLTRNIYAQFYNCCNSNTLHNNNTNKISNCKQTISNSINIIANSNPQSIPVPAAILINDKQDDNSDVMGEEIELKELNRIIKKEIIVNTAEKRRNKQIADSHTTTRIIALWNIISIRYVRLYWY